MPLLGELLFNLFTGLVTVFVRYVSQKVAITLVLVAMLTTMFVALFLAVRTALAAAVVSVSGIHPMFATGISMVIPQSSASLISSYLLFWSMCELYKWKFNMMQLWSRTI